MRVGGFNRKLFSAAGVNEIGLIDTKPGPNGTVNPPINT
jgi:hypothetical protein